MHKLMKILLNFGIAGFIMHIKLEKKRRIIKKLKFLLSAACYIILLVLVSFAFIVLNGNMVIFHKTGIYPAFLW